VQHGLRLGKILAIGFFASCCSDKNHADDDSSGPSAGTTHTNAGRTQSGAGGTSSPGGGAASSSGGNLSATGGTSDLGGGTGSGRGGHAPGGSSARGGSTSKGGTTAEGDAGVGGEGATAGIGEAGVPGNRGDGGGSGTGGFGGEHAGSGGSGGTGGVSASGGTGGVSASGGAGGVSASGGAGGVSASGGIGGVAGKAGAGGSGALTCSSASDGLAIVADAGKTAGAGWIDATQNCVGIQGAIYTKVDDHGSTMKLTSTDGEICVSGVSKRVEYSDYEEYTGAKLIIDLHTSSTETAGPYDASAYGVKGFAFTISGSSVPGELRPTLTNYGFGTQFCERLCAAGAQELLYGQAHASCWTGTTGTTPAGTNLQYLEFSVPSNSSSDVPFNFCVSGLSAMLDAVPIGDLGTCPLTYGPQSCVTGCSGGDSVCHCDSQCESFGDCCPDYATECL